ncbi:hypothetical protein MRQ36_29810 [Micromonospora sp. R77]|uniref:hypothetical protein n=1 Tax=Micromonospora sp. R77 TaxID=2925836 RepID=UPI001F6004DC|nr:hypothetical protein [Micromonospora sp. R77]MCI4066528.1 hypothetical protein [Micromonospora sp. R77]
MPLSVVGRPPPQPTRALTTAAILGAVDALLIGPGVTLLTGVVGASSVLAIPVGVVVALVAFAAQVGYIFRASLGKQA